MTDFAADQTHVKQLAVELAFVVSNDDHSKVQPIHAASVTLGDYIGNASILRDLSQRIPRGTAIDNNSGGIRGLRCRAIGDFNHDGVQDLLTSSYMHVTDGNHVAYGLRVVARLNAEGALVSRQFKQMK